MAWFVPLVLAVSGVPSAGTAATTTAATAIAAGSAPATTEPASDAPLQCWLRSSAGSLLVGEPFDVTVTCSVLETPALAAIPDFASLEPATIQLAPFEVTGGVRHPDVVTGSRRYVQFRYAVRLIGDGWFGQDVALPAVTLKYTLATSAGGGAAREGRERSYRLPSLPIRVLSLVPPVADGLREPPGASFAQIEARRARARFAAVAATALAAFAAVFLFLAAAALLRRPARRGPAVPPALSGAALFDAGRRAWRDAKGTAGASGWTPSVAAQGLAGLRISAAVAAGLAVRQAVVAPDVAVAEGQVATRRGLLRPRRVLVSASVTPAALAAAGAPPREAEDLAVLGAALRVLGNAAYGRGVDVTGTAAHDVAPEEAAIDAALARCRLRQLPPLRALAALRRALAHWRLAWAT